MGNYMSTQRKIWRGTNKSKAFFLLIQKGRYIDDTSRLFLIQFILQKQATCCSTFRTVDLLSFFLFENNGASQSRNAVGHSDSTRPTGHERPPPHEAIILRLMEDFATRKSSNEHKFFAAITSLNKIGEGRI